jgi:hypothetical protein
MTTYVVATPTVTAGQTVGLLAASWPIRIIQATASGGGLTVARVTGASMSGGTAVTITPMRQLSGVPSALATAKYGTTVSGTSAALGVYSSYQPPSDLFVNVGSAFTIVTSTSQNIQIYYEEVHLARST